MNTWQQNEDMNIDIWVERYLHNSVTFIYRNEKNRDFRNSMIGLLKEVIGACIKKESGKKTVKLKDVKKLKIIIVNQHCYKLIRELENPKYEHIILIPQATIPKKKEKLIKHKLAHEIAHFLFALQKKHLDNSEEIECNKKATEWGFPEPENKGCINR